MHCLLALVMTMVFQLLRGILSITVQRICEHSERYALGFDVYYCNRVPMLKYNSSNTEGKGIQLYCSYIVYI
jgi:hypothetical protein